MFVTKQGYYGENDLLVDNPVSRFVPYEYTEKDFNKINKNYLVPCFNIQTEQNVILKQGILFINTNEYDISSLLIKDVILILNNNNCIATLYENYLDLQYLPAYLLSDFNNYYTYSIKANKSPYNISNSLPNIELRSKGILVTSSFILDSIMYDTKSNKEIKQTIEADNNIYFEPSESSVILIKEICNDFSVCTSLNLNTYSDIANITNIIKNGSLEEITVIN